MSRKILNISESGASEIVGEMMMLAITVTLFVLLSVAAYSLISGQSPAPIASLALLPVENGSNAPVFQHEGGDPIAYGNLEFIINGVQYTSSEATLSNYDGLKDTDDYWNVGDTITIKLAQVQPAIPRSYMISRRIQCLIALLGRYETMRNDNSGISTIIGAILVLVLVISVIAVIKVTYVPEIKKQAEADHMQDALKDFNDHSSALSLAAQNGRGGFITSNIEMGGGSIPFVDPSRSSGTITINPGYGSLSIIAYQISANAINTIASGINNKLDRSGTSPITTTGSTRLSTTKTA